MKIENITIANSLFFERDEYLSLKKTLRDLNAVWSINDKYSNKSARLPFDAVDNMRAFVNEKLEQIENQIKEL